MRLRILTLVAAALTGLLGPTGVAYAAIGDAGPDDPVSTPAQDTSATADAATANDAGVEQVAGQTQLGGTNEQPQQGNASPGQSGVQHGQNANVGQQADADADAKLNHPENENASARVGASAAGDGHGASQKNSGDADASATTTLGVGQQADHPGNAQSQHAASGDQSANASAHADVDRPANTNVTARVEAPGHDGAFDQSNAAKAKADAKANGKGADVDQQATAAADATLESPSNTAIELRVESDGDSDGGTQSNAATADAAATSDDPDANASVHADATVTNPSNTFVSVRVNSDGTTGDIEQSTTTSESETVNGVTAASNTADHADNEWTSSDPSSGVEVTLRSDGTNTDLRVGVENAALPLPSTAPTFVWTWDLVFGPGAQVSCDIHSSVTADQVTWSFDCDPNDQITRSSEPATSSATAGAISWTWSWDRPELPGWSWDRADVLPMALATCNCRYVIDFRWISYEPTAPAAPQPATAAIESATPAVSQSNEASASAVASATADVQQSLIQSGDDTSDRTQSLLQQAEVVQIVSATASSQLNDALNESEGLLAVSQVNSVVSQAAQSVEAEVLQSAAQTQLGTGSTQVQIALQSASTRQRVSAIAVAISARGVNSAAGWGATKQSVTSKSAANGHASASTRQVLEQAQQGDRSDQQQLAAQWTTISQDQRLVAASGLSSSVNETRLAGDAVAQRTSGGSASRGSSSAAVLQAVVQIQVGDDTAQLQESYQVVDIAQDGEALAAVTAGGTHRYVTPPAAQNEEPATTRPTGSLSVFAVGSATSGLASPVTGGPIKPRTALPRRVRHVVASATHASPRRAAHLTQVSTSRAGSTGTALKRARDAGGATSGSPRRRGTAPQSIGAAAFGSSGAGTGGAHGALARYVLLWAPGTGRRVHSPAGRRPAAVHFARKRPG